MKKVLVALGVSAAAISLNMGDSYADSIAKVNTRALNVRSGPGTNYSKIGIVYKGNTLSIIETKGMWSHVQLNTGLNGWVYSKYIKQSSLTNTTQTIGTINVVAVNVRSDAGKQYDIIKVASQGTKVKLIKKSNGWCNIELPSGTIGWISEKYIDFTGNIENENNNNSSEFIPCNGKVTCRSNLNVRSGPSTSYTIKAKLYSKQVVKLIDKSNGWYKVSLTNGVTGWVKDDYIKITSESVTDTSNDNNLNNSSDRSAVINLAYSLLGKPYVWGANGPNSFDCSGFTRYVYLHAEGKSIPRVSYEQAKIGNPVSRGNYLPGDLLYFTTNNKGTISHVGIYVGNNTFIHASSSGQVKLSTLDNYYSNRLLGARRF